ncbi:MAG: ornithine carbamoyltransferase [Pleurocapsa minor GSE-CHR-MK-17-07R]|jgi:ornithine carbamoyltransferase|nr:ornithine carbamoyltransferase [Pleurocapsa minor GSE-CHR-MK 17-07R]
MRHYLDLADWRSEEIRELLDLARFLRLEFRSGGNKAVLAGKTLAMIFQKPSLRTKVSFETGMNQLGGAALMLGPDEIGLGKRESTGDVAKSLSRFVQCIMARVFAHETILELGKHATVPVINGLTDSQHPCQALADVLTIQDRHGRVEGLRIAFVGDGNNVAFSLGQAVAHLGGHFAIASPEGYSFSEDDAETIAQIAAFNGSTFETFTDPVKAVRDADVIYTDTWVSMGQESDTERRLRDFREYQVNANLLKYASRRAIVMHCMPAHRGQEITDEVMDGARSAVLDQAENRLHAQKAILVKLMTHQQA